jgi:glycosyltransferase involved in cell wall biosynthesis
VVRRKIKGTTPLPNPIVKIFRRRTRPDVRSASILIPVFCESENIPALIDKLAQVKWPVPTEWIFIDDASTDDSVAIIERYRTQFANIRLLSFDKNRGKGSAIHEGIRAATGDLIAVQDADNEYDPKDLASLMTPILEGRADVVYGTRYGKDTTQVHRTYHRLANLCLTLLSNFCSNLHLSDMEVCYKVFRSDVLRAFTLECRRFGFEPEVTAYIAKFDLRIHELPVRYNPRSYLEGKKIGWKDGVAALWHILRFNFLKPPHRCLTPEALESFRLEHPEPHTGPTKQKAA